MFCCIFCGQPFKKEVDFHHHLMYDELYTINDIKRFNDIGVFDTDETNKIIKFMKGKVNDR